jgi:hypothetical protein
MAGYDFSPLIHETFDVFLRIILFNWSNFKVIFIFWENTIILIKYQNQLKFFVKILNNKNYTFFSIDL